MEMKEIWMFFYQSTEVVFLFKELTIQNFNAYILCLVITFLLGFLWEIATFGVHYFK